MGRYETVFVASIIVAGVVLLASEPAFMAGLAVALAAFSVLWLVSLALRDASIVDIFWGPGGPWLVVAGLVLWAIGFVFEAVADWQLLAFKRDPASRGRVLDHGLWGRSRHPNYFGEAVLWWGIGLIGAAAGGPLALVGPALLSFTLVKISGVAMLDRELVARRPGYAEYIARTPGFLPFRIR